LTTQPESQRTFVLRLSTHYIEYLRMYAFVYRHLTERLGREAVEELWSQSDLSFEDDLFSVLITTGWTNEEAESTDLRLDRKDLIERLFTPAVQGVTAEEATSFLLGIGPFRQLDATFRNLAVQRAATTYEALHLLVHGLANFAEAAIDRFGKAAEFMIYDALKEEIEDRLQPEMSGQDYVRAIHDHAQSKPAEETEPADPHPPAEPAPLVMGSAGHVEEIVRVAEDEIIVHMTQCSWADYYLERHPTVGQLLGCCADDPTYRRTAKGLRLQRQFTLMEGDACCDFRIYPAESGDS
jgi:L-2-amino-thiazoline-4-carboxylic acid hydrolase-like protein